MYILEDNVKNAEHCEENSKRKDKLAIVLVINRGDCMIRV